VTYDGTVFNYTKETDGDAWYERCSRMTLSKEGWGSYDQGVVSRSGFGDGEHICWTARKEKHVVGIILDFNMIKYNNELLNLLVWDN
jgi:hypothetical protein